MASEREKQYRRGIVTGVMFTAVTFIAVIVGLLFIVKEEIRKNYNIQNSGYDSSGDVNADRDSENFFTDKELEKIKYIEQVLDAYSYYDQDDKLLMDGIYSSLLYALDDKYATYYNEEDYKSFLEDNAGEYSGVGCVVTQNVNNGQVVVVMPYEGSPAYEAGLAIGDILISADDHELTGMDLSKAVSYIKGEEGTKVKIVFLHDGEEKTVEVERRKIEIPTVSYEMKEDNIGYISISGFDEITVSQFSDAVDSLIADGAKGFIFDIRSNPGGSYTAVVSMLDKLLPEGVVVYQEYKNGEKDEEYSDAACIEMPMAVIINGDSASASEIFAGALQDYDWAEIIGTQSFGKGIVQSILPLGDGTGIKFTCASYFTPKGICIHGVGITPDEVVELPTDEECYDENGYLLDEYDTQLNAAVEYIEGCIAK